MVENDDRSYGLCDMLERARCGIPVVWDALHHRCVDRDGLSDREALALALDTWPSDARPKIHYSSPRLDVEERKRKVGRRIERYAAVPQLRSHADLIDPVAFEYFLAEAGGTRDFDIMLEAKAKDLALLRLREQLAARGIDGGGGELVIGSAPHE